MLAISPKTSSTYHGINNIKAITLKSLTELLNQSYCLWLDLIRNIIIIYPSYSALNLCPGKNYNTFSSRQEFYWASQEQYHFSREADALFRRGEESLPIIKFINSYYNVAFILT